MIIHNQHHHFIANILHHLVGGLLGLVTASLSHQFGWRSADRLPGESRWPHCLYCLKPFVWQEIFPLFGWLLRPDTLSLPCPCGKRQKLWSQPLAELMGFALGLAAMHLSGWSLMSFPLCLGLGLLPAITLIDLHYGIIPDGLNLLLAFLGFTWFWLSDNDLYMTLIVVGGMLGIGLFCAIIYSRWRGKEMLGLGDVKFFAAAGFWLQPEIAPWFLAGAGLIGVILGFFWERLTGHKEFPFAPALCISLMACILYSCFT